MDVVSRGVRALSRVRSCPMHSTKSMSMPSSPYVSMRPWTEDTALATHESIDLGAKKALVRSCTLSPPNAAITATFGCARLMAATADGVRAFVSQNGVNTPLVGVGWLTGV
ncbi:hypothetical protein EJB05_28562 [Eragrostis curvula]|uniref:Uncharacterized protein n=1 Tax=Eragrostis curvula TaxID=38414 RepID=A0A5J9UR87_9POAL|nr:hypothetical protein EJB05_28562 [Eragrostis curvula]